MRQLLENEKYRRIALIGVAILLAFGVGLQTLLNYRGTKMQQLRESYDIKRLEYDKYFKILANRDKYVKLQAELGNVEKGIVGLRFLNAKTTSLAEVRFQDMVDTIAKKNGLALISRKVLKTTEVGDLKELRVAISCRTEIGVLNEFMYDVGKQDAAIYVESLDIKRMGDKEERYYNFNAVLKAYSL